MIFWYFGVLGGVGVFGVWGFGFIFKFDIFNISNYSGQMVPTSHGSIQEPAISSQMQYIAKIVFVLFVLGRIPYESIRKTLVAF